MNREYFYYNLQNIANKHPELTLGKLIGYSTNFNVRILNEASDEFLLNVISQYFKEPLIDIPQVTEISVEVEPTKKTHVVPENKGRIYLHNTEGKIKAVFENEVDEYLNNGWKYGRKEK